MRKRRDDNCDYCKKYGHEGMCPSHEASPRCQSGKRSHCTCDTCF